MRAASPCLPRFPSASVRAIRAAIYLPPGTASRARINPSRNNQISAPPQARAHRLAISFRDAEIPAPRPPPARRCCRCSSALRRAGRHVAASVANVSPSTALRRCPMCAALFGIDAGVLDNRSSVACAPRQHTLRVPLPRQPAGRNAARSKNAFKYPPPATSTRAMPAIGFSELAISCASARGGFFSRLASSKQRGEAASPMVKPRRAFGHDGHVRLVTLVDVMPQRLAKPLLDRFVHVSPCDRMESGDYRGTARSGQKHSAISKCAAI